MEEDGCQSQGYGKSCTIVRRGTGGIHKNLGQIQKSGQQSHSPYTPLDKLKVGGARNPNVEFAKCAKVWRFLIFHVRVLRVPNEGSNLTKKGNTP